MGKARSYCSFVSLYCTVAAQNQFVCFHFWSDEYQYRNMAAVQMCHRSCTNDILSNQSWN